MSGLLSLITLITLISKGGNVVSHEKELAAYFAAHTNEFLDDLRELIAIPSIKGNATESEPFGPEPARVLTCALRMAERHGFYTENWGNRVGTIQLAPGERRLDILAHLDVVPADGQWAVTEPFTMKVQDGRIYGRGTADDKGPALAALYALRAIKDLKIPLSRGVRLVLGTDEECGSSDLDYYFQHTAPAEMSFSPDADFPVINIERGRLTGELSCTCANTNIVEVAAGSAVNIIPESAEAVLRGTEPDQLLAAAQSCGMESMVTVKPDAGLLRIHVCGTSAHAASPEAGVNPVTALIALLAACTGDPIFQRLHRLFPHGDIHGSTLGIDMEDSSGRLTLSLTCLYVRNGTLTAKFDCRVPVCGTEERLHAADTLVQRSGFSYRTSFTAPHYVPADSELVRTLRACYERMTGLDGRPIAIGGGTYAHGIPNAVAFGCAFRDVDNHMHGNDEFAELRTLQLSQQIFAQSIIALCG